jgi:hypothetical protein
LNLVYTAIPLIRTIGPAKSYSELLDLQYFDRTFYGLFPRESSGRPLREVPHRIVFRTNILDQSREGYIDSGYNFLLDAVMLNATLVPVALQVEPNPAVSFK